MYKKISYEELKDLQKENCNYAKVAARLADYGYSCERLSDDQQGADFMARHVDGKSSLKVQLKSRLTVDKKYLKKKIHIAFIDRTNNSEDIYIYLHDDFVKDFGPEKFECTETWKIGGEYYWKIPPGWAKDWLEDKGFKI